MIYSFLVGSYARKIYIDGTQRFTARDGFSGISTEYHQPVKQYAADKFTRDQIDAALAKGYVNQQEYDETIALITAEVILPSSQQI
jgi:hypothetical protein